MMHEEIFRWAARSIPIAWAAWLAVWAIASFQTKPAIYRESIGSRLSYTLPIIVSVFLLFLAKNGHWGRVLAAPSSPFAWLFARFIRLYPGLVWLGAPLVVLGILVSFWARFHLSGNWSGAVTLKQDHQLIRTGPYRFVRHPIYTGVLMALLGSAFAIGQVRGLFAFALTFFALWYKSRSRKG